MIILEGTALLKGNSENSIKMVQTYLDITSDIQTVGLASIHLKYMKFPKQHLLKIWFKGYREILNKLQLYQDRFQIDKCYNQLELLYNDKAPKIKYHCSSDLVEQSISLKCFFCACSIGTP